jgi:hypothetical protein
VLEKKGDLEWGDLKKVFHNHKIPWENIDSALNHLIFDKINYGINKMFNKLTTVIIP